MTADGLENGATTVEAAVDRLILESALKTEKAISLARVIYGTALVVFTLNSAELYGADSVIFSSIPLLIFVGVSVLLFARISRLRDPRWVFPVSVAMDASVAFISLLPDVLWPWPGYGGMINLISASGMLISTFAAGFRLSVRVAVFGSLLNAVYFAVLMALDHRISGHPNANEIAQVVLFSIFLFGAAALAVVVANLTRRLVHKSAVEAVRATRARQRLDRIVQDHHDLRTTLTAVTLSAGLIKERLESGDAAEPVHDLALQLESELRKVKAQIDFIKGETFAELVALNTVESVNLTAAMAQARLHTGHLFPAVALEVEPPPSPLFVAVAGGRPILERILFNLLVNACEGDGARGASRVSLRVRTGDGEVTVEVTDDGPGFAPDLLRDAIGDKILSTKAGGSGLGLLLANGLARASSGGIALANQQGGGAVVSVRLKLVDPARANR